MDKLLLFCVETNKRANTDYIYISETLNNYYSYDNHKVSIKPVYLETKTKYNSKEVQKTIREWKKAFSGTTIVIYCIDTDSIDTKYEDSKMFEQIQKYCDDNKYELAWFCHDVEEVYLGKQVSPKEKVSEAAKFRNRHGIVKINEHKLRCKNIKRGESNFMTIMDKYLERK